MQLTAVIPYMNLNVEMVGLIRWVEPGRQMLRACVHALSENVEDGPLDEIEFIKWAAVAGADVIPVARNQP